MVRETFAGMAGGGAGMGNPICYRRKEGGKRQELPGVRCGIMKVT
jgi:hypothetical protein